jgi:hypothetical protein
LRPITAIAVLLLVGTSLLISGCTTSTTNQTASATTSTATQHDALLEEYLAAYKNELYSDKNESVKAFEIMWINSTSARVETTMHDKTGDLTMNGVLKFIVFPRIPPFQAATQYLDAMNKTAYRMSSTMWISGGLYEKVTGHEPLIYKDYSYSERNQFIHEIAQLDNIVVVSTWEISS